LAGVVFEYPVASVKNTSGGSSRVIDGPGVALCSKAKGIGGTVWCCSLAS
jgi:hypothetical protein